MSKTRKPGSGGYREGARRPKNPYKSVRISFRVHPDLEDPIKKMVRECVKKHKANINLMESNINIPIGYAEVNGVLTKINDDGTISLPNGQDVNGAI
ncbi:MAG TPA: hypothetical protein PK210_04890 [Bacteroidia bacterium]|nr:hypothetical protein [Bacteroidia bacterium]